MANNNIQAGRAFVSLGLKDSEFQKGLKRAARSVKQFGDTIMSAGKNITAVGAVMAAPFISGAKIFSDYGDSVAKMSKRTGIAVEELSKMEFVAAQSALEFGTLENSVRKMQKSIYDGSLGMKTVTDALDGLGLKLSDVEGKTPTEQLAIFADALKKIQDPGKKAALAMSIFGKSGTALLPMFEAGADGIRKMTDEAERAGLIMSKDDSEAAEKFNDALGKTSMQIKAVMFQLGAAVAGELMEFKDAVAETGAKVIQWVKDNRELVASIAKAAAIISALGVALLALGGAVKVIAMIITAFSGLVKVLAVVKVAILALGTSVGAAALAFAPMVAVIATIGALLYGYIKNAKAAEEQTKRLTKAAEDARKAGANIATAFEALKNAKTPEDKKKALEDLIAGYEALIKASTVAEGGTLKNFTIVEQLRGFKKQLAEVNKEVEKLNIAKAIQDEVDKTTEELKKLIDTFGMTADEIKIFELKQKGATDEQIAQVKASQAQLKGLNDAKASMDTYTSTIEGLSDEYAKLTMSQEELRKRSVVQLRIQGLTEEQINEIIKFYDKIDKANEKLKAEEFDKGVSADVDKLRLESMYEGIELQKKLLDLEEKAAVEEAKKLNANIALVREKYALTRAALDAQAQAEAQGKSVMSAIENVGTLNLRMGGTNTIPQKQLKEQEKGNQKLDSIKDLLQKQLDIIPLTGGVYTA